METLGNILRALLGLAGIGVFYIYFPWWASRYAKARGRDTLATISKVSIFILLGPLGGLIALIGSASNAPIEGSGFTCPECGSTAVKTALHTYNATNREDLGTPVQFWTSAGGGILIGALLMFLSWGVWTEFLEWAGMTGPVPAVIVAAFGLGAMIRGVLSIIAYVNKDNRRTLKLTCSNCKHEWEQSEEPVLVA